MLAEQLVRDTVRDSASGHDEERLNAAAASLENEVRGECRRRQQIVSMCEEINVALHPRPAYVWLR